MTETEFNLLQVGDAVILKGSVTTIMTVVAIQYKDVVLSTPSDFSKMHNQEVKTEWIDNDHKLQSHCFDPRCLQLYV